MHKVIIKGYSRQCRGLTTYPNEGRETQIPGEDREEMEDEGGMKII